MITITGNFEQLTGASTGYVTVTLANYGGYVPTISGTGIVVGTSITSALGSSFSISLYGNDAITPSCTYYTVTFYNLAGTIASVNYQFTGSSTIDLSTYSPMTTTLAAYSGNPVVTNPLGSQTINGALTITGRTTVPTPANPTDAATKSYVDTALTFSTASQTANTVWAGPTTGSAAAPAFRGLVAADLPTIPNTQVIPTLVTVTYSATPTFDFSQGKALQITLAGNVTPTFINATTGSEYTLIIRQNSTGGYSFTFPSNYKGGVTAGLVASTATLFKLFYDGTNFYLTSVPIQGQ